jgi:predicted GNAT family N-acyltransferase
VRTAVVSTAEQLQQVFAVRAAVFMSEQGCPYEEEFDGNDYCATHVLALADARPAAAIRVRYFSDFAKLERLAVLRPFRGTPVTRAVVEAAVEICRRELPRHHDAITMESDPYLIIRPEGAWDTPGVLEQSAARPITSPH